MHQRRNEKVGHPAHIEKGKRFLHILSVKIPVGNKDAILSDQNGIAGIVIDFSGNFSKKVLPVSVVGKIGPEQRLILGKNSPQFRHRFFQLPFNGNEGIAGAGVGLGAKFQKHIGKGQGQGFLPPLAQTAFQRIGKSGCRSLAV